MSGSSLKQRFDGDTGKRLLTETLKEQKIVGGDTTFAEDLIAVGELLDVAKGTPIIEQGATDNHVYLILTGSFDINVNGRIVAKRIATDHVGEMSALQPTQRRSASVIASEPSVVLKLTEVQLNDLGSKYPNIWRVFAKELARRLLQRNQLIGAHREKIRVFIVSSAEALEIARAIQNAFEHDPFAVVIWTDGVFRASNYAIESLERELDQSDFALAIAQPDDETVSRGQQNPTPRDNVIFELGLFIGRLGRHRAILLEPRGEEVKLPSDLTGLSTVPYKYETGSGLAAALGPACNRIRQIITELGPNM